MADFRTHITASTVLGVGYGAAANIYFDVPLPTCLLAGSLCSVSGMLPDLDSDSGVPLRESIAFAAAVVPMLMLHRFIAMGLSPETIALIGAGIYAFIRFVFARLLKWYTVHRGMFHSLPAAVIAAELAFLVCTAETLELRLFKAGAVLAGFMSHLVLDEIWSIEWKGGRWRLKKSAGTAMKLWGKNWWANLSTYAKLGLLTYVVMQEPTSFASLAQQAFVEHHNHDHGESEDGTTPLVNIELPQLDDLGSFERALQEETAQPRVADQFGEGEEGLR